MGIARARSWLDARAGVVVSGEPLLGLEAANRFALFGRNGRQERERLGAGAASRGVVQAQRLAVCVGDWQLLVAQLQRPNQGVVDPRRAAALGSDVVPCPELGKALAADRELANRLVEPGIVDVGADQRPAGRRPCSR